MAAATRKERRQSQCPACGLQRGTPLAVTIDQGRKDIDYRCESCGHEWKVASGHVFGPISIETS